MSLQNAFIGRFLVMNDTGTKFLTSARTWTENPEEGQPYAFRKDAEDAAWLAGQGLLVLGPIEPYVLASDLVEGAKATAYLAKLERAHDLEPKIDRRFLARNRPKGKA